MRKFYIGVVVLYALTYLVPLGIRPFIIPDETRYAEVPREMIDSGDWIVPRLNGVRYFEKPVLGYWLSAASIRLLGQSRFAVRLSAALAAGLTALLLFALAGRHATDRRCALSSVGILLSSVFFYGVGTFAVLDMPLTLFLTGAMVCFFCAYKQHGGRRRLYEALFGVFCGLAFLTKGFLAFAVPFVTVVPFMLWEKRWRELFTMAWVPILTAFLVCLPWGIAIHLREPDFWHFFFWHEHVQRFMADDPQHSEAVWFFLPVLLGAMVPWTLVLPAAVSGLEQQRAGHDALVRYCLCWFLFPLLFFSISSGKLSTYILPCLPPLALLMASGLQAYLDSTRRRLFDSGAFLGAALLAGAGLVLIVHETAGVEFLPVYNGGEQYRWVLFILALVSWVVALLTAGRVREPGRKLLLFSLGPVLFMVVAGAVFPNESAEGKAPEAFLQDHVDAARADTTVVVDWRLIRAVCWSWKRDDVFVIGGPGELEYGLEQPDAGGRFLSRKRLHSMILDLSSGRHIVLIAEERHFRRWRSMLPPPLELDVRQGFAFARFAPPLVDTVMNKDQHYNRESKP